MSAPEGWDEIPEEARNMAKAFRDIYVAFLIVGFTSKEASTIIAKMWAEAGSNITEQGSVGEDN